MTRNDVLSAKAFVAKFREAIRVGFNWERFTNEAWPVEPGGLQSADDLSRCFMPWYIGKGADEVAYDHAEAVPMSLADVSKALKILNEERQGDIQQYVETFRKQADLIEFSAPAYALPNKQYFILDRNHRLSALSLVSAPFKVTLWNVAGPLEPECLLDLIHWT